MSKFIYADRGISEFDRKALAEQVLTTRTPLGAPFLELYGSQDRGLYQYLFDGHSQYLYEQKNERPSIIVGRKGSGKSTYLNNLSFKGNVIPVQINQWKIMDEVQQIITSLMLNGHEIRAERASYIWQWLFLSAAAIKSSGLISKNLDLKSFVDFFPVKEIAEVGISALTGFVKNKIHSFFEADGSLDQKELASIGWILEDKTEAIDKLEKTLSDELKKNERYAIILLDNEEDVMEEMFSIGESNLQYAKEIAISGLLNAAGRTNIGAVHVQLRYCIPAEQFFAFKSLSKSTGKDFSDLHLLHWSVGELLSMIAHRYLLHIYVWKDINKEWKEVYEDLKEIPIYSRTGALEFFRKVLPEQIINGRKIPEDTLTYILRHFQILPRQLITLFNSMVALNIKLGAAPNAISPEVVVKSIHEQEASMADEIMRAYKPMYPEADKVRRKVLPNIPLIFRYKDIRRFYDGKEFINTGKSVLSSLNGAVEVSPDRLERCLIETGMVGRVIGDIEPNGHGYINAEFEYSMPGSLDLCEDDYLVVHPIFSGQRLKSANKEFGNNVLGVYPHDADPHEDQDRDFMRSTFVSKIP